MAPQAAARCWWYGTRLGCRRCGLRTTSACAKMAWHPPASAMACLSSPWSRLYGSHRAPPSWRGVSTTVRLGQAAARGYSACSRPPRSTCSHSAQLSGDVHTTCCVGAAGGPGRAESWLPTSMTAGTVQARSWSMTRFSTGTGKSPRLSQKSPACRHRVLSPGQGGWARRVGGCPGWPATARAPRKMMPGLPSARRASACTCTQCRTWHTVSRVLGEACRSAPSSRLVSQSRWQILQGVLEPGARTTEEHPAVHTHAEGVCMGAYGRQSRGSGCQAPQRRAAEGSTCGKP